MTNSWKYKYDKQNNFMVLMLLNLYQLGSVQHLPIVLPFYYALSKPDTGM